MRSLAIVRMGGLFLIGGAVAFMGVFAFLAARFNYPEVLDGSECLGELSFSVFFLLSGLAMLARGSGFPRWIGFFGVFTAVAGMIGMFRNVTGAVDPIAAVNNYLLPLWMIIFGVALIRYRHASPDDFSAADSLTA